jgi:hypothetical protein
MRTDRCGNTCGQICQEKDQEHKACIRDNNNNGNPSAIELQKITVMSTAQIIRKVLE